MRVEGTSDRLQKGGVEVWQQKAAVVIDHHRWATYDDMS